MESSNQIPVRQFHKKFSDMQRLELAKPDTKYKKKEKMHKKELNNSE